MREASVSLVCLPHAGGSSYSYLELEKFTAPFVRILPIELPGRGRRFSDPLMTDLHSLAQDALEQARGVIDTGAYAIFGHSLGARLGYVLARSIAMSGLPMPVHLFLSGSAGPSVRPKNPGRYLLPKKDFLEVIADFGGTPPEVLREDSLMEVFEPVLRADFQASDTYTYRRQAPLAQPMTVMIGADDTVSYDDASKWRDESSGEVQILVFSGGHFFIFEHWDAIGRIISRALQRPAEPFLDATG